MAYTLNTGHPLYGNLVELIGVQGGALVSHKTARTFTPHASATFGSGSFGEHLRTGAKGWDPSGATLSPNVAISTVANPNITTFLVVNNIGVAADAGGSLTTGGPTFMLSVNGQRAANNYSSSDSYKTATILNNGAKSISVSRIGETSNKSYINGVLNDTGGILGYADASHNLLSNIGGFTGQGACGAIDFVWLAFFDKELSAAETLSLHNSLGASNAFGLVTAAGGTNYTLTLDTGSYSITGENLVLGNTSSYVLSLDAGSYNIQSFSPVINIALGLDAENYILSGNDLTLSASSVSGTVYSLVLEDGIYAGIGQDIGTILSYNIQLDQGTYSLDGKQVRLVSSTEPVILVNGNHTISISLKIGI